MPKQIKLKQKVCRNTTEFVPTSGHGAHAVRIHWRKLTVALEQLESITESFTLRVGELMSTSFFHCTLFGLNLCRLYVFCPSLCQLRYAPVLCLLDTISFKSSITSGFAIFSHPPLLRGSLR